MGTLLRKYGGATGGDLATGPAPIVWNKIPVGEIMEDRNKGFGFFEDWLGGPSASAGGTTAVGTIGQYIASSVGGAGDIEDAGLVGGVLALEPTGTENQGMQIQSNVAFTPAAATRIAWGARIKVTDNTQLDAFYGLAAADTDVAQSNPNNHIGFATDDGDDNIDCLSDKAGSGGDTDSTVDLVDDTFINLEFLVDELDTVKFYINGVLKITETTSDIPIVALAPTLAQVNGAATANWLYCDWMYCYLWHHQN